MKITKTDAAITAIINQSLEGKNLLSISYVDASNKPTVRSVEGYEIKNGKFFAHCRMKNATRAFSLERIQSAEILSETYIPRF